MTRNAVARIAPRLSGEYVYRCFDVEGRLLYVGLSNDVRNRWKQHRANSTWFDAAVRFTLTGPFTDRTAAARYEVETIQAESPLHNVRHTGDAPAIFDPRPRPSIEALHEAAARSGIQQGTLCAAFDKGFIDDYSTESLMAWIARWPEFREMSRREANRRRSRSAARSA